MMGKLDDSSCCMHPLSLSHSLPVKCDISELFSARNYSQVLEELANRKGLSKSTSHNIPPTKVLAEQADRAAPHEPTYVSWEVVDDSSPPGLQIPMDLESEEATPKSPIINDENQNISVSIDCSDLLDRKIAALYFSKKNSANNTKDIIDNPQYLNVIGFHRLTSLTGEIPFEDTSTPMFSKYEPILIRFTPKSDIPKRYSGFFGQASKIKFPKLFKNSYSVNNFQEGLKNLPLEDVVPSKANYCVSSGVRKLYERGDARIVAFMLLFLGFMLLVLALLMYPYIVA